MQYVSLTEFRKSFPGISFPLQGDDREQFRTLLYERNTASVLDNERWIQLLSEQGSVLFMEWIGQETDLRDLLLTGKPGHSFQNKTRLQDHALFAEFRKFLTPFLYPVLEGALHTRPEGKELEIISYSNLLSDDQEELIQGKVYEFLKDDLENFQRSAARADSEEALVKAVQPFLRPSFTELLNSFHPKFYRARANWMEALISIGEHRFSSKRLLLHISRQLESLQLNPDHREELKQLDRDIKSGAVEVERTFINWKRVIALSFAGFAIVALIWFIWDIPAEIQPEEEQDTTTAFMAFSEEERKTMDSLLQQAQHTQQPTVPSIDQEDLPYMDVDLVLKNPLKNETAARLLSQWSLVDSTFKSPAPAGSKADKRSFPGTKLLSKNTGAITAAFNNDTDLSVFILIFDDRSGAPVYSGYLSRKSAATFLMGRDQLLYVLPGSDIPEQLRKTGYPFEKIDSRFYTNVRTNYVVSKNSPASVKFVWKQLNSSAFYLLDLNGALDTQ